MPTFPVVPQIYPPFFPKSYPIIANLLEKVTTYPNLNIQGTTVADAISNIMVYLGNVTTDGESCVASGSAGTLGMFHCTYTKENSGRRMMMVQNYSDIYYADHEVGVAMHIYQANHTQIQ